MASINQYLTKNGNRLWGYYLFGGCDPLTGKQKRIHKRGFKTKKEAELSASRVQVEISRNGFADNAHITFKQVYELWFEQYKNTVKESTYCKTFDIFRLHILPIFGDKKISTIKPVLCQKAVNDWFNHGYAKCKVFINDVSRIFKHAIRMNILYSNPVDKIIIPKNKDLPRTMENNYYDKDELKHFLECLKKENNTQAYTFFRILAFGGLRKSEALVLTYKDIDFTNKTININKTQSRGEHARLLIQSPKTYNSKRIVHIDDKTINTIKEWRIYQRKYMLMFGFNTNHRDQMLFTNNENRMLQPSYPRKWLEGVIKKYNLKHITVHGFRHTYATLSFEAGLSIKEVQTQLGHRDFKTTMDIYTAVTSKQKNEIADKFTQYVNF